MIEVSNLVKKYGDHTAVDHLSFQIEKGKIYGFLGPNGAGKSTTMNMITGYIASTEGKVRSMVMIFWRNRRQPRNVSAICRKCRRSILT